MLFISCRSRHYVILCNLEKHEAKCRINSFILMIYMYFVYKYFTYHIRDTSYNLLLHIATGRRRKRRHPIIHYSDMMQLQTPPAKSPRSVRPKFELPLGLGQPISLTTPTDTPTTPITVPTSEECLALGNVIISLSLSLSLSYSTNTFSSYCDLCCQFSFLYSGCYHTSLSYYHSTLSIDSKSHTHF